jgi:hypothetical protein
MRLLWRNHTGGNTALLQVPERRLTMKPLYLYAIALGVVSGIAIAYIQKCKQLEHRSNEQADEIKRLHKFIYEEVMI